MPVKQVIEQGRVPVKVYTDDVEAGARDRRRDRARHVDGREGVLGPRDDQLETLRVPGVRGALPGQR